MLRELMINTKNKTIKIDRSRIYKKLHASDLLEKRLEEVRSIMKKKYDCDYLGIHLFNQKTDLFFSNIPHDIWHDYYWAHYMQGCPTLKMSSQLKRGENGFLFFFDYNNGGLEVRTSIINEQKEGFTIMFHNDISGNKMQFTLTFKDNKSISSFDANSFRSLIMDLKKLESVIDDFIEYFDKTGEIKDSIEMSDFIRKKNYVLSLD